MTFTVKPQALKGLGGDFRELATTATYAYYNIDVDMNVSSVGGSTFALIVDEINSVRDDLLKAYKTGGMMPVLFEAAGDAIEETAEDYRAIDASTRATIDGQLKEVEETEIPWTSNKPGVDLGAYRDEYAPIDVDPDSVLAIILNSVGMKVPKQIGRATDHFDSYNQFVDIAEGIDYVISFNWVGDSLGMIGLPDPFKVFNQELKGDWRQLGTALGALELVIDQERAIEDDLDGMIKSLSTMWQGNAANSCAAWIADTGEKISGHAEDLNSICSRINSEAMTIKSGVDTVQTAVNSIVELIPDPNDIGGHLFDVLTGGLKTSVKIAINALTKPLEAFKLGFDAIMTGALAIVTLFAQITRFDDSAWPVIPQLNLPDVDG